MTSNNEPTRVGLVADPDSPQRVAEYLADELPDHLASDREWSLEHEVDPIAAGKHSPAEMLRSAAEQRERNGWDYAVCLTDLPVRVNRRPVLIDIDEDEGVAVVSLPALGGVAPYRRTRQAVLHALDELTAGRGDGSTRRADDNTRHGLTNWWTRLVSPIQREVNAGEDDLDIRYTSTRGRGRVRLISGMVRTNRPWRLVFGMAKALAAALATSAFGLTSGTIWKIGDELPLVNMILVAVVSISALAVWLILAHGLWERVGSSSTRDREQAALYNSSTVLSLTIGVGCLYGLLFVVNLGVAGFIVPSNVLAATIGHPVGVGDYLMLAWAFTTMGVIAGALGSSLETDQAVRQAAYGYRERQRREEHQQAREAEQQAS